MKIKSYFAYLVITAFVISCSSQHPVGFGSRKFYPDAAKNNGTAHAKPIKIQSAQNQAIESSIIQKMKEEQMGSFEKVSIARRVEVTKKAILEVLVSKPKLKFKEKLALKILNKSLLASATDVTSEGDGKRTPGSAIAGFVLGILSLLIAGVILGPLAIIFSAVGLSKPRAENRNGLAIAGLICGIIGFIGALIIIASM